MSKQPQHSAVVGTTEMAKLVRDLDWSSTPLGSMNSWSPELLSITQVILASPLPSLVFWGEDLVLIYNDAGRFTVGTHHPVALGACARDVWREAWHIVGPEVEAVLSNGQSVHREAMLVPLDRGGELKDLYWNYSYSPIFERGRPAGVLVICQEVTESVLAVRNLEILANKLDQVLEATSDGVVIVDRAWRFSYVNAQAHKTVSVRGDVMGQNVWEAFPAMVYPESPFVLHYHRAMEEGVAGEFVTTYPEPLNVTIHITVHPSPEGIIIFFRDITEEKRREALLVRTEKLAAMGRMAASIAHEINNPLESVTNLLYLARRSDALPEVNAYLDDAEQELRRVSNIVNQTLRFHKQASRPQQISCLDLFSTVLDIYQSRLRNAGITVEKRKRANKPVEIYEGDIRQVLNNLVGNAIDAMPRGGRLLVRSREGTDWTTGRKGLVLTIADTGIGMDPATQARVFEVFFTTKGIGGTGLGLWVSAEIVERHRGRLRVRSSQTKGRSGTVFALFLPFEGAKLSTHASLNA